MANTGDLKSSGSKNLEGSSPSSGTICICGHEHYTHRGKNSECHGVDITVPKKYMKIWNPMFNCYVDVVNWTDPDIWCKCNEYKPISE